MPDDKTREYQRRYYEAHREDIARRKRERYESNPKVRAVARKKARRYYAEKRRARPPGEREQRGYNHPRVVSVDGKPVMCYGVGKFCKVIARSVQAITQWESRKVLPPPTVVDHAGRRWYSERHMAAVAAAVKRYEESKLWNQQELAAMVAEEFAKVRAE